MGLTKKSEPQTIYLEAKHFSLWQAFDGPGDGIETLEVRNPSTGAMVKKHGIRYDTVEGIVTDIVKYDRKHGGKRYFGFKMHMQDQGMKFVLDLPYKSQILRRLLQVMPNIDWAIPLSITVFKGKKDDGSESTGIWLRQRGETVKAYFTKETPHGMPQAKYDQQSQEWDFREQLSWLVTFLQDSIFPKLKEAVVRVAPPVVPAVPPVREPEPDDTPDAPDAQPFGEITDDDVPF